MPTTSTSPRVEIGVCTSTPTPELATRLADAGARYYEPTIAKAVMADDAETFDRTIAAWSQGGLSPRSANVFLPPSLPLVGDVDWDAVEAYLAESFRRMKALGIEVVVFGSGGARNVPEHLERAAALDQLERFMRLAAAAADSEVVIALEHLRRQETNVFNTLEESGTFLREREVPGVRLVVDVYHLWEQEEDVSVVRRFADLAAHVHVCAPQRRAPGPADGAALDPLLRTLADVGYSGRCSLECHWESLETQGPVAVAVLGEALERAGLS